MSFGKGKDDPAASGSSAAPFTTVPGGRNVEAFLGHGSKVVGNLTFNGPVELDGYIEGEIHAKDKLTIGESAVVNAKINGSEILVRGTVNGDIIASKRLSLEKPAKVVGNIKSDCLSIEEGVVFEGTCAMKGAGVETAAKKETLGVSA